MKSIYGLNLKDMEDYFISIGSKKFHADQLFSWLYEKRIESYDEVTNIKKELIEELKNNYSIERLKIVDVQEDVDVCKYLFELEDNEHIEAVLMKHDYGNSICISSQIGCNMGCKFCQSGRLKKIRNLTASEMVLQVLTVQKDINERISHVVIMGIGEPFDNYDNFMNFIRIVNDPYGLAIGQRHITVSTSGLVKKIYEFADEETGVNLAISLHASTDEKRNNIMPINKAYNISEIIKAVKYYIDKTNRRVTFEYILLKDINDTKLDALNLCKLLKGINCYVNLIPYNETENTEFKRSNYDSISNFYDILKKNRINATIRKEFGSNVSAACGQLRAENN